MRSQNPSLVLFSGEYYSWSRVTTTSPRALFVAETPTDAERVAAYEPVVARSPNFKAGSSESYRYRLSGDTLWVDQRSEDVHFWLGDRLVSPSAARELRLVLRRLQ